MGGTRRQNVKALAEVDARVRDDAPLDERAIRPGEHPPEIEAVVEHGDTWRLLISLGPPQVDGHT